MKPINFEKLIHTAITAQEKLVEYRREESKNELKRLLAEPYTTGGMSRLERFKEEYRTISFQGVRQIGRTSYIVDHFFQDSLIILHDDANLKYFKQLLTCKHGRTRINRPLVTSLTRLNHDFPLFNKEKLKGIKKIVIDDYSLINSSGYNCKQALDRILYGLNMLDVDYYHFG